MFKKRVIDSVATYLVLGGLFLVLTWISTDQLRITTRHVIGFLLGLLGGALGSCSLIMGELATDRKRLWFAISLALSPIGSPLWLSWARGVAVGYAMGSGVGFSFSLATGTLAQMLCRRQPHGPGRSKRHSSGEGVGVGPR